MAIKTVEEMKLVQGPPLDEPNGVERNAEDEDEDDDIGVDDDVPSVSASHLVYNTRFKGVKRVKMEREGPDSVEHTPKRRRRRPKKREAEANPAHASGSTLDQQQSAKRRRGRPRKYPASESVSPHKNSISSAGGPPDSRGKQIFDGVVLQQRPKKALVDVVAVAVDSRVLALSNPSPHDPDADAEGDMDAEAEEAIWIHSSTVQTSELPATEQGIYIMNSLRLRCLIWHIFVAVIETSIPLFDSDPIPQKPLTNLLSE